MDANPMPPVQEAIALIIRDACETDPNWATPPDDLIEIRESELRAILEEHLAALSQPPAVPEGWALVPVEPTLEMVEAACTWKGDVGTVTRTYAAMVSAAPPAPSSDPLAPIRSAIADYHLQLDNRKHRDVVGQRVLNAIEAALAMPWQPGAEKARRDAAQEGGR